ncbi:MAG TPA: tRNA(Ile)-lysidine synthase, partial [Methanomicrobiales archaeon]|nr:tRNA(Ile)-lysidine synthase [Methanomicrobiales archaeon]
MRCDRCGSDAIVFQRYSGQHLCGDHLQASVRTRAMRRIRSHGWIRPGDRIAVALSGGRSSSSLLHFLFAGFGMRRDLSLVAVTVDDGMTASRDLDRIGRIASGMGIEWATLSLADEYRVTLQGIPGRCGLSCTECSGLLDRALATLAREVGGTKLALGTNLDNEARSVLGRVLGGEASRLLYQVGTASEEPPRIRPFLGIPDEELALYASLNALDTRQGGCAHALSDAEREAGNILDEYRARHPSAPFSLVSLGEALTGGRATRSRGV